MRTRQDELVEFYRQLSLLVRSDLPLPGSLDGLARECENREFKAVLRALTEDAERGLPLTEAMRRHPRFFPPFHVRMVRAGEKAGTLSEVLVEVAEAARFSHSLVERVRDLVAYPVFTTVFALGVFLTMLRFVVREFGIMYRELVETSIPLACEAVFRASEAATLFWGPAVTLYVGAILVVLWFFSGQLAAQRLLRRVVSRLPGAHGILADVDAARLCGMWSVLTARQVPLVEALEISADMTEGRELSAALLRVRDRCAAGTLLPDAVEVEDEFPGTIKLSLVHAREKSLPEELDSLKDFYAERATQAMTRVGSIWELSALLAMALVVAGVILAMFLPLIELNRQMIGIG